MLVNVIAVAAFWTNPQAPPPSLPVPEAQLSDGLATASGSPAAEQPESKFESGSQQPLSISAVYRPADKGITPVNSNPPPRPIRPTGARNDAGSRTPRGLPHTVQAQTSRYLQQNQRQESHRPQCSEEGTLGQGYHSQALLQPLQSSTNAARTCRTSSHKHKDGDSVVPQQLLSRRRQPQHRPTSPGSGRPPIHRVSEGSPERQSEPVNSLAPSDYSQSNNAARIRRRNQQPGRQLQAPCQVLATGTQVVAAWLQQPPDLGGKLGFGMVPDGSVSCELRQGVLLYLGCIHLDRLCSCVIDSMILSFSRQSC
eukprot:SAG31_NODE_7_length_42755_cov_130.245728_17_plen_311_part_00